MRNLFSSLLFCLIAGTLGCGKESEATSRGQPPSSGAASPGYPGGPPQFAEPSSQPASSVPAVIGDAAQPVTVEVESVERERPDEGLTPGNFSHLLVAIKLKVTNNFKYMNVLLQPQRFWVETKESKERILPRFGGRKTPILGMGYLRQGASTSGWLLFEIPRRQEEFYLKTDLKKPPLSITIPMPSGAAPPK